MANRSWVCSQIWLAKNQHQQIIKIAQLWLLLIKYCKPYKNMLLIENYLNDKFWQYFSSSTLKTLISWRREQGLGLIFNLTPVEKKEISNSWLFFTFCLIVSWVFVIETIAGSQIITFCPGNIITTINLLFFLKP